VALRGKSLNRANQINYICLLECFYDQFLQNASVPNIIDYMVKYVRSGRPITPETLAKGIW
jgi:hypothetical protein